MSSKNSSVFYKKHRKQINLILRCLIVFIIPIIAGLLIFKAKEIHPFGENDLLSVDLWGQYFPMYRQFAESNSFAEAMYSWSGALGFNNFVQSAFYCRSLFLILFKLVPIDSSIIFVDAVCLLRLGLSALTCELFLEYKFKSTNPVIMASSVCYGLCAYAIAFIMQFMWTDCIVLAPFVLLGLEKLIDGKSPLLYVISLTLTIYTNFYLGFGVCLFTAFYFIAEMVKRVEINSSEKLLRRFSNRKSIGKSVLRFALYSLLAGCMTAVIIIPTLKGLSLSMSANEGRLDFSQWYHTLADNVNALLPLTGISLEYGVANIAAGLFLFILIPLFFLNTSIKFREKLASGALILALYSGLNYNPMDYVFNGFHFPNQLPGRWSFLFSLALVIIAANGIARRDGIKQKSILGSWIVGVFFLLFTRYSSLTDLKEEKINTWIIMLTVFSVLLSLYVFFTEAAKRAKEKEIAEMEAAAAEEKPENPDTVDGAENAADQVKKKKLPKKLIYRACTVVSSIALASMMAYEACSNSVAVSTKVNNGVLVSNMTHYLNATNLFTDYGKKYDSGSDDLYRVETNLGWTFNDGQLGGFKGMTYYGSTLNGNTFKLLRFLGNRVYAQNVSTIYNNTSIVQNGIFGIRYFIDRAKTLNYTLPGVNLVEDSESCMVWENNTALPVAFAVSRNVKDFRVSDEIRPVTTQNNLVNLMYGEEINVYEKLQPSAFNMENAELNENANWNDSHFYRTDETQPVRFNYVYTCPNDQPIYMEHNFRAGSITVTVNDAVSDVNVAEGAFRYIGTYPAGTEINIAVEIADVGIGCFGLDVYSFNTEKWQNAYNKFSSSSLDVSSFKNTKIEGTINMADAGMIFTSIPQDGGWKVYVDGKKVEDFMIADTLIGFNLSAGTHEVTFKYHVPGYALGLAVTIITLLITIFCFLVWKKRADKEKKSAAKPNKVLIK